jgi:hypothetical protein
MFSGFKSLTIANSQYKLHVIFTVHFCTIDQLTPTNAPNQVLSLISLLKDFPNIEEPRCVLGKSFNKEISDKLVLVHLLV